MQPRILYLYTSLYRSDSGHARRSEQIINALAAIGCEVEVLAPPSAAAWQTAAHRIHTTLPVPGLAAMPLYRPSLRRFLCNLFIFFKALHLNIRAPYSAIHCCDRSITVGRWITWFTRARLVIEWRNRPDRTLSGWSRSFFRQRILRAAALIISDERCALVDAKDCECADRLAYIPATPSDRIRATPRLFIEKPARDAPRHVTTLASHTGFDGIDTLINAAPYILAAFPNTIFHIAGGGEADIDKAKKAITGHLPQLQPRLDFTGPLSLDQLSQLLEESDALYARYVPGDNIPISLLDQMASGRPIVAADCPANTTILDSTLADIVPPDPERTANAIISFLSDPQRSLDFATAALDTVEIERNRHAFIETIRTCYTYALNR